MARIKLRKFKCNKCDRTFSMAAHLARHQNTLHASKARRKAAKKKAIKRKLAKRRTAKRLVKKTIRRVRRPARRVRRAGPGDQAPLLRQMQAYRSDLLTQRAQVTTQIDAIDRALAALSATPRRSAAKPARRRGPSGLRRGSLKYHIDRVLRARSGTMAVRDVTTAVRRAGFRSKNKTLAKSVGIALSQMPNVTKVSRGMFRAR